MEEEDIIHLLQLLTLDHNEENTAHEGASSQRLWRVLLAFSDLALLIQTTTQFEENSSTATTPWVFRVMLEHWDIVLRWVDVGVRVYQNCVDDREGRFRILIIRCVEIVVAASSLAKDDPHSYAIHASAKTTSAVYRLLCVCTPSIGNNASRNFDRAQLDWVSRLLNRHLFTEATQAGLDAWIGRLSRRQAKPILECALDCLGRLSHIFSDVYHQDDLCNVLGLFSAQLFCLEQFLGRFSRSLRKQCSELVQSIVLTVQHILQQANKHRAWETLSDMLSLMLGTVFQICHAGRHSNAFVMQMYRSSVVGLLLEAMDILEGTPRDTLFGICHTLLPMIVDGRVLDEVIDKGDIARAMRTRLVDQSHIPWSRLKQAYHKMFSMVVKLRHQRDIAHIHLCCNSDVRLFTFFGP